jgi:glycerate-2-kinase
MKPGETLVYAGETTVSVKGNGRGGRNQELALAASIALRNRDDVMILSLGTDGIDGMSRAAGGFADGTALDRGRKLGLDALDHLDRNDSHPYLTAIGDVVNSGPTGTNVGDLILVRRIS